MATIANDGYIWLVEPMLNEGAVAQPYSPHPEEIYSGNTIIDNGGVTISNGALQVINGSSQVVIDGQFNMHKIMITGTTSIYMADGQAEASVTIAHGLGYKPCTMFFIDADGGGNAVAFPYLRMQYDPHLGIIAIGRAGATSSNITISMSRDVNYRPAETFVIRYYVYKEVAI